MLGDHAVKDAVSAVDQVVGQDGIATDNAFGQDG